MQSPINQAPRKRGRPPITKDYANPLESPMAHSSLRVQRQGTQNFSKPLMKVGQVTPTSKKRRQSNSGYLSNDGNHDSPMKEGLAGSSPSSNSMVSYLGTTKKGRYRGIILSTPVKNSNFKSSNENARYLSTPTSKEHPSKSHILKSSPLEAPLTPFTCSNDIVNGQSEKKQIIDFNFSLSLNINSNGKATIGSSPVSKILKDSCVKQLSSPIKRNTVPSLQKKDVLFLLKKMKIDASYKIDNSDQKLMATNFTDTTTLTADDVLPTRLEKAFNDDSEQKLNPNNKNYQASTMVPSTPPPPSPMSPSNFFNFQMKTGLTPNFNGSFGVLSPFRITLNHNQLPPVSSLTQNSKSVDNATVVKPIESNASKNGTKIIQPGLSKQSNIDTRKQYVFKHSVGDPLLLNDESVLGDHGWQENISLKANLMSPGHSMAFNTPPSFLNFGSPGSLLFSPPTQRRDSSILVGGHDSNANYLNTLRHHQHRINSSQKGNDNIGKSSRVNVSAVELKTIDSGLDTSEINIIRNLDQTLNQENKSDSKYEGFGTTPYLNKENASSLMPPSINMMHKFSRNSGVNINYTVPKMDMEENPNMQDLGDNDNDIFSEKADEARTALKSLIQEKFS